MSTGHTQATTSDTTQLPARLQIKNLIAVHIDICQSVKILSNFDDGIKTVLFFDGFYTLCGRYIEAHSGELIKYMGDSVLAIFDENDILPAITAVQEIRKAFPSYCESAGINATDIRAGIHIGEAIIGEFGSSGIRDVLGRGSSLAIQMSGPGITLSEQVYRKLPSEMRGEWKKRKSKVKYHQN